MKRSKRKMVDMIRKVIHDDLLDMSDHEAIAAGINDREGVGTTCCEEVEVFMRDIDVPEVVLPDEEMMMRTVNAGICY